MMPEHGLFFLKPGVLLFSVKSLMQMWVFLSQCAIELFCTTEIIEQLSISNL